LDTTTPACSSSCRSRRCCAAGLLDAAATEAVRICVGVEGEDEDEDEPAA
jgi:hypothetical protein